MSQFPPLDPSVYVWAQSAHCPVQWKRSALAGEALWVPRPKDYHEMFLGGSLTLESPTLYSALSSAVNNAWRRLRFEVPELVVTARFEADGNAYMQYQVPTGNEEVVQWVAQTTSFQGGKQVLDFDALREQILQFKKGRDSGQAFLLLRAVMEDGDDFVKRVGFMLNTDHQITDGVGIRILLDRYLALLAETLGRPLAVEQNIDWQESAQNLTPPWIGLVNEEQLLSGPGYERVAGSNEQFLLQQMPQNAGLPLLRKLQTPTQKSHFLTLSYTLSTQLLRTIKTLINPASNITHLGHAAMVLALLRSNPPPSHSKTFFSPCWLNGRRYLNPFAGHLIPTKSYIPICQSFAPIIFPDLNALALPPSASKDEVKEMLIKTCRIATGEYEKIKERKSILPESVVLFERLGKNMYLEQQQNLSSRAEFPPNNSQFHIQRLRANHALSDQLYDASKAPTSAHPHEALPIRTADPFFLSDGVTEQYISQEHFSHASTSSSRRKILEVHDVVFAANAEKNLIVRMSSWRGRITVSGEWRECDYDGAMIVRFLEDLVKILCSILD